MTGNRLIDVLLYILIAVLVIWLIFVIVDRIDDEDTPDYINPSAFIAGLE